jgi:hypothetical protein
MTRARTWDPKKPVVPLADDGGLLHYPEPWRGFTWERWHPFRDGLRLEHFARGRSAAYAVLSDEDGRTFPMMLADLEDFMKRGSIVRGRLTPPLGLTWTVRKRGQNYGIRLAAQ